MRPKIAQQRIIYPAQAVSPGFECWNWVNAYAQDLGIPSRKLGLISLVCRDLARSNRRPGLREERQDHVLTIILDYGNIFAQVAGQRKCWSSLTYA
jgi:hypothetical protein